MSQPSDIEEIIDNFEFLGDWEERYRYIIDLGKQLDGLDDAFKTEENKVRGCMSQVWFTSNVEDGDPPRIFFNADSDATIVRGLIAILLIVYSGKTPAEIRETDIKSLFERLGLSAHLSPSRSNGFFSMVSRIRGEAEMHR
jgi:cysteine desulfuration protein SufE